MRKLINIITQWSVEITLHASKSRGCTTPSEYTCYLCTVLTDTTMSLKWGELYMCERGCIREISVLPIVL